MHENTLLVFILRGEYAYDIKDAGPVFLLLCLHFWQLLIFMPNIAYAASNNSFYNGTTITCAPSVSADESATFYLLLQIFWSDI